MNHYSNIENYAAELLIKFMGALPVNARMIRPIPIEAFARYHLGLNIEYTRLSDNGGILGITTYADTDVELRRYHGKQIIHVPKDTILLDERLLKRRVDWVDKELGRRRFTIAHECAHQIIFRAMPETRREELKEKYSARIFSLRELSAQSSRDEKGVNALAAALLMPLEYIKLLMGKYYFTQYGKRFNRPDSFALDYICNRLDVSRKALVIRLRHLGYVEVMASADYYDPTDIYCDDYERG